MKFTVFSILLIFAAEATQAQELEPRAYANLPKDLNAIALLYGVSRGNVIADPSLPIADFKVTAQTLGLGYVRTFAFAKRLARVQLLTPFTDLTGKLKLNGVDTSGARVGFGDARLRLGINILGSPALSAKEFRTYQQKTLLGVSLITSIPTGLYFRDKRINLGSNRWGFKPEVGISRRFKRIYAEAYTGIWFFTNNKEFLTNKVLTQEPVFSIQGHLSYYFKNQIWIGINANWFTGGQTKIDEAPSGNLENNWRIGATLSVPINPKNSLKLQFHVGAFTSKGYDYNFVALSYQYVFF